MPWSCSTSNHGRRAEPLEAAQLAGAVKRQETLSRPVLAQQIAKRLRPERVAQSDRIDGFARRAAFFGGGGAVGFQPIVITLPQGTMMGATGVVSADRRYVRIAVAPIFSTIGDVQTFTFAGQAEPVSRNGGGGGCWPGAGAAVAVGVP